MGEEIKEKQSEGGGAGGGREEVKVEERRMGENMFLECGGIGK